MSEEVMIPKSYHDKVCEEIIRFKDKQFYDAVHLLDDGTLEITVVDCTKVKRVLVEDGNNLGNLFYEDADRPQGEWIPCSERLPEEREWIGTEKFGTTISDKVLVTFELQGKRFVKPMHFQNGELGGMDKRTMDAIHGEWKAVAWMPLPKPWKGADDE